jgi:hypothetical protein
MPQVPFSPNLQENYRNSMEVTNSPPLIDTDEPVKPVIIVGNGTIATGLKNGVYSTTSDQTVTATADYTHTIVVPAGETWLILSMLFFRSSGNFTINTPNIEIGNRGSVGGTFQPLPIAPTSAGSTGLLTKRFVFGSIYSLPDLYVASGQVIQGFYTCSAFTTQAPVTFVVNYLKVK